MRSRRTVTLIVVGFAAVIVAILAPYLRPVDATESVGTTMTEPTIQWHTIGSEGKPVSTKILVSKVPGGWLVQSYSERINRSGDRAIGNGLTFVPDPEHSWLDVD